MDRLCVGVSFRQCWRRLTQIDGWTCIDHTLFSFHPCLFGRHSYSSRKEFYRELHSSSIHRLQSFSSLVVSVFAAVLILASGQSVRTPLPVVTPEPGTPGTWPGWRPNWPGWQIDYRAQMCPAGILGGPPRNFRMPAPHCSFFV